MTSRRKFIGLGIGAAVLPGLAQAAEWSSMGWTQAGEFGRLPLYKAIYEKAYVPAQGFAARMQQRGVVIHGIDADITGVWFNDLALQWRRRPVAIAGLTAPAALFCLEQLAWDHRMRVAFRATHMQHSDGTIEHRIQAPQTLAPQIRPSLDAEPGWGASMADLAMHCPLPGTSVATELAVDTRVVVDDVAVEPLVSWVIAPVNSA